MALLGSAFDRPLLESVGAGALFAANGHLSCIFPDHDDHNPSARWDRGKSLHFCTCWLRRGKRAGDILDVIARMLGCSLIEAADHARRVAGLPLRGDARQETAIERARRLRRQAELRAKAEAEAAVRRQAEAHKRAEMEAHSNRLYARAPLDDGGMIRGYFDARGARGAVPLSSRYLPGRGPDNPASILTPFGEWAYSTASGWQPPTTGISALHRIFVKCEGDRVVKATKLVNGVPKSKVMYGSVAGQPIMLFPPNKERRLIICEGVDTGVRAHQMFGGEVWAAGAASNLRNLAPLVFPGIDEVWVFADNDEGGEGLLEARKLVDELRKTFTVYLDMPDLPELAA